MKKLLILPALLLLSACDIGTDYYYVEIDQSNMYCIANNSNIFKLENRYVYCENGSYARIGSEKFRSVIKKLEQGE